MGGTHYVKQADSKENERKTDLFISCGQYTDEERDLGNAVAELVRVHNPYEPYFAEQQNTLEGLVSNILNNLARAAGFIGVMHNRGIVNMPEGARVHLYDSSARIREYFIGVGQTIYSWSTYHP